MQKDSKMFRSIEADHFMVRKLEEWKEELLGFHSELNDHFQILSDFPEHKGLVCYKSLFPFSELCFNPRYSRRKVQETGIATYGIDDFAVRVFHDHVGKEIRPHDIVDEVVPKFFRWEYYIDRNTDSKVNPRKVDESTYWPPFFSPLKNGRPWIAIRHLNGLQTLPEPCSCCGHRWGNSKPLETSFRLILALWGIGKDCINAGYQVRQTIAEVTEEPYNIW